MSTPGAAGSRETAEIAGEVLGLEPRVVGERPPSVGGQMTRVARGFEVLHDQVADVGIVFHHENRLHRSLRSEVRSGPPTRRSYCSAPVWQRYGTGVIEFDRVAAAVR